MAYAALVSLEHTTDLILNHHKYFVSVVEREQITTIREYVSFLISFFDDLPEKANRLEGKIRDVAYEAEDLMEYQMWNEFQKNWPSPGPSRFSFECQLKRVREKLGSITGEMMEDRPSDLPAAVSSSRVGATGNNDVVIGLRDDRIAIVDRLYGSSTLEVIPIVGMGGIGKTTLAQHLYDDSLIVERFDIRVWVTVSQDYSFDEILRTLLDSIKLFNAHMLEYNNESTSNIAEKVYKALKGRRYLIVMDDVWSTHAWDAVRYIFPDDKNGSRIMLTTRLSDVAAYASWGSPVHEMKFMDEDQSWNLLKQKALAEGQDCPPELEQVGKEIARGCGGLPLAVVLVAGILSTVVKSQGSWMKIANNVNAVVDGQLEKILSLSYAHLPHHLRPCFLFLAGFPEDHNIQVSRLIKLLVAEGFLRHQDESKSLEDEAEEYVEDLVKRSLVLISTRKTNGKLKCCRLHDLVRDMCIRKAEEENFLVTGRYLLPGGRKDKRRISMSYSNRLDMIHSPTIRTILYSIHWMMGSSLDVVVNFRLLRVLDVIHWYNDVQVFHPAVFELFHLRYLAIGVTDAILEGISNLENLQTLILHSRFKQRDRKPVDSYLAEEIWRMHQLRHLVLPNGYGLPIPADGLTFPLHNLQTLSAILNSQCKRIFQMVPNLKKLDILRSNQEHGLHNLANLQHLEKLNISGCFWQERYPVFPLTLKKLTLDSGYLPWEEMSIVGSLPNLQVLKLRNNACYGETWETRDGEFTNLKFLVIHNLEFEHWITESLHFPRLKCLVVHCCKYLKEIPTSIADIPTLELIDVTTYHDQKSLVNSVTQIQDDQLNYGNDTLQVRCNHFLSAEKTGQKLWSMPFDLVE